MGANHSHDTTPQATTPRARRLTLALLVPAAVLTVIGMLLLWPKGGTQAPADGPTTAQGEVMAVRSEPCPETPDDPAVPPGTPALVCGTVTVKLTAGPGAGQEVETDIPSGPGAVEVSAGDRVTLYHFAGDDGADATYSIVDHQRSTELWMLGAAFALAVIAFGRWRGLTALAGLGVTFAVLLLFVVPAILEGRSPLLVAVVGSAAIMLTVLYLTHGPNLTTTVAVAGTLVSLAITGALSALATAGTHLTGIADETSSYLNITHSQVNMHGLLLAGIVIGSLGVLDDVTVTQSATVAELARANPGYGFRQLYAAATRIGRAHIASVINTIVLAYAGASLPLMLLFTESATPLGDLLTNQLIAQELVRSAVGTLGLIAAVPVTTALAAALASRRTPTPAPVEVTDLAAGPGPTAVVPAPTAPSATAVAPSTVPAAPSTARAAGSSGSGSTETVDPWVAFVERRDDDRW
ncbi:MAG TPA: YibE/F family protein [Micromonospora sp.]